MAKTVYTVYVKDPSGLVVLKTTRKIRWNVETMRQEALVSLGAYGWKWLPLVHVAGALEKEAGSP